MVEPGIVDSPPLTRFAKVTLRCGRITGFLRPRSRLVGVSHQEHLAAIVELFTLGLVYQTALDDNYLLTWKGEAAAEALVQAGDPW